MRYLIGIDLGTTNCALTFVDTEHPSLPIQLFKIPQLIGSGRVEALSTLPSFCYLVDRDEWPKGALQLPWKEEADTFVGQFAKVQGGRVPTRLVQSAKSWLCHVGADRRDKILPIEAADPKQRLSPVGASAKYLTHLRDAWNATMAKGHAFLELEDQEIILTVPASFDEIARELTVEAARQVGFSNIHLLEEPQAAFYSWISQHEETWQEQFHPGETLLVCDVGGGTTDFSLIEIQERGGQLSFQRMAVGDHLLLGGDNMDAALAREVERTLLDQGYPPLELSQWLQLYAEVRQAKEKLLSTEATEKASHSIVLQGTGASVVKGTMTMQLQREEVEKLLVEEFFGNYSLQDALQLRPGRGFRTMGLPYEDEPSITKHLAYFLKRSHYLDKGKGIDYILFNGGAFKPEFFQLAIEKSLRAWFPQTPLRRLSSAHLDLAVARGAAYYAKVRRGDGVAIVAGLPRTYYLKMDVREASGEVRSKALTLLPRGSPDGYTFQPSQLFSLRANQAVTFHVLTSHVRLNDREGELLDIGLEEMQLLPPIQTILRFGRHLAKEEEKMIPVRLGIRLTAIGTLELWLESEQSSHRWDLEFQLRPAMGREGQRQTSSMQDEIFAKGHLEEAKQTIETLFDGDVVAKLGKVMERLEEQMGSPRREWGTSVLRELWPPLFKMASQRRLSPEHEARWWNLAGFFLRPGTGYVLDDFRIKELWKIVLSDLKSPLLPEVLVQLWICFRRIAAGLNKGQQMQLGSELIHSLLDKKRNVIDIKRKSDLYFYSEKIRTLASFERLDLSLKVRLGDALLDRFSQEPATDYECWSLGRIGGRQLLYGSIGQVVPREICARWIERLLSLSQPAALREEWLFLLAQLARKTEHRELNIPDSLIQAILKAYPNDQLKHWLEEPHQLTNTEQELVFGEKLPAGLVLNL